MRRSRMNMGGDGAKMIRAVMKSKGVSSLEKLIQDAYLGRRQKNGTQT